MAHGRFLVGQLFPALTGLCPTSGRLAINSPCLVNLTRKEEVNVRARWQKMSLKSCLAEKPPGAMASAHAVSIILSRALLVLAEEVWGGNLSNLIKDDILQLLPENTKRNTTEHCPPKQTTLMLTTSPGPVGCSGTCRVS